MPFAQDVPWYIIAANIGQIVTFIVLPIFLVVNVVFSVLLFKKVAALGAATAPEGGASGEGAGEPGDGPDISDFVE